VEVLGDAVAAGEEFNKILGYVQGLDGADAEACYGGFAEDAAEQVDEFYARREVSAIGTEIDAA
jgi:hypothetical protein